MTSLLRSLAAIPARFGRPVASTRYIAQIDGLRFLAIASVLVWHSTLRATRFSDGSTGSLGESILGWVPHGEVGVALFFFISGFIIAQPFIKGAQRGAWPSTPDFYQRRLIRIVPPYLIVMAGCFVLLSSAGQVPNAPSFQGQDASLGQSFAASVLYIHGILFNAPPRLNPPTWSLEIEMQFYLISPLLVWLYLRIRQPRDRAILGVAVLILSMLAAITAAHVFGEWGRYRWTLLKFFHLFWAGILVADATSRNDPLQATPGLRFDALFVAGLAGLAFTGVFERHGATTLPDDPLRIVASMLCAVAVYYGGMRGRIARRLLAVPAIALIGTMCYSVYLVHVPAMHVTAVVVSRIVPLPDSWATMIGLPVLLILVSLLLGFLYYVTVERLFMLLARGRRPPAAAAGPAGAPQDVSRPDATEGFPTGPGESDKTAR
ncbi:acyltransferase [Roseomonas sp. OT10]|uniref:acyltransferase family protein n=1 Tax=Roseomonas cutis TaxID=2897332 RepID=UPI001E657D1A|nr:acyltransferase [Roseomonas sp. OT10]UFN50472.1 acyltransferase [Roseomonas sp. OT10]